MKANIVFKAGIPFSNVNEDSKRVTKYLHCLKDVFADVSAVN